MNKPMTSYERVMNRLEGKPVDKIPNMNLVMAFAAKQVDISYKTFCTDYKRLVESKLVSAEVFGIDTVSAISDPMREAAGFGAKVILPDNDVPYCEENLIADLSMIKQLKVIDPLSSERMLDRVRAIELFKSQVKGKIPIIGWVEGVLAEAADLRGVSELMMDLMLEPNAMIELFEILYEQQKAFAKVQVDAGADFIGIGNAVASLIGPELYGQFCLEYEQRIIKDIHAMGAKVKLHICGNTEPILGLLARTDADIFDVDHVVDFSKAIQAFHGTKTVANGNLDPVSEIMSATEGEVVEAVKKRILVADERTMISGGCEIPRSTPKENMVRMNQALYL
jgi:MtaA/CmuA family methyltransferase